jgi:hypothetical protein
MQRKLAFALLTFILIFSLSSVAFAQLAVGVKKGDWIEYKVSYTGAPVDGHNMDSARMEVLDVQGNNISVKITSTYANGTINNLTYTLNLEKGQLIDDFIIPANLKSGDTFYDQYWGNVTISKVEHQMYAGATRTVLYGYTSQNTYVWDQATGVSVEGISQTPNYSIHSVAEDTNMWHSGETFTSRFVYLLVALALIVIITIAIFYKRSHTKTRAK